MDVINRLVPLKRCQSINGHWVAVAPPISFLKFKRNNCCSSCVSSSERAPLPSNRHHRSCGDCLESKGENYQVRSVQIVCNNIVHSAMHTHMNRLTVLWIRFCLTGPISLCLDSFLYCVLLCVVCMLRFVTRCGGPCGIEAYP